LKNRFNISFIFGLLFLAIHTLNLVENFTFLECESFSIELSEFGDQIEEEEFFEESFLYDALSHKDISSFTLNNIANYWDIADYQSVYIKLHSPPPEFT